MWHFRSKARNYTQTREVIVLVLKDIKGSGLLIRCTSHAQWILDNDQLLPLDKVALLQIPCCLSKRVAYEQCMQTFQSNRFFPHRNYITSHHHLHSVYFVPNIVRTSTLFHEYNDSLFRVMNIYIHYIISCSSISRGI